MSTVTPRLGLTKPAGSEQYSVTLINNNSDLIDTWASGTVDKLAKGIVSKGAITANGAALTTLAVQNNIASYAFKGGRKYRIVWHGNMTINTAANYFDMAVQTCSTADAAGAITGLTQLGASSVTCVNAGAGQSFAVEAEFEPGADTTLQVKFTVNRTAGGGTLTLNASATNPCIFYIEDCGAQY